MDSCTSVEREVDKFLSKTTNFSQSAQRNRIEIDQLLSESNKLLPSAFPTSEDSSDVTGASSTQLDRTLSNISRLKTVAQSLANEHKELHSSISKIGKSIDKHFIPTDGVSMHNTITQDEEKLRLTNQVVCGYLLKQGHWEAARSLIQESCISIGPEKMKLLNRVSSVIDALKQRNIEPAVSFVTDYSSELSTVNSGVEFFLSKLQFVELILHGKKSEALSYAPKFARFASSHSNEIQILMGALMYGSLTPSESNSNNATFLYYSSLLNSNIYEDLTEMLISDLCALFGFSNSNCGSSRRNQRCHLSTCIEAGCQFLPSLINLNHVMMQGKVGSLWSSKEELPIEMNLKICKYHSLVACPILKGATNEENPAMRLYCGHIISRDALNRISSSSSKMKCPYCPVEQNAKSAVKIEF